MTSISHMPINFTKSTEIHTSDSSSPKKVFKIDQQMLPTSNKPADGKKKGKGPDGECCNCGGENCDKKDKKPYSDW